jgi:hypothetical protein
LFNCRSKRFICFHSGERIYRSLCRHNLILYLSIEQELATHRIEIASLKVCSSNFPLLSHVFCHFNPSLCAGRTLPQAAAAGTRPRQFSTTQLRTRVHDAIAHFHSQSLVLLTILLSPVTCDVQRVTSYGCMTHLLGNHDWHSVCTVMPRRTPSLYAQLLFVPPRIRPSSTSHSNPCSNPSCCLRLMQARAQVLWCSSFGV